MTLRRRSLLAAAPALALTPRADADLTGGITLTQAGTTAVLPWLQLTVVNATTYHGTLYAGWPQAEQSAFSTSPIPTTNAAVTRAADALSNPRAPGRLPSPVTR